MKIYKERNLKILPPSYILVELYQTYRAVQYACHERLSRTPSTFSNRWLVYNNYIILLIHVISHTRKHAIYRYGIKLSYQRNRAITEVGKVTQKFLIR